MDVDGGEVVGYGGQKPVSLGMTFGDMGGGYPKYGCRTPLRRIAEHTLSILKFLTSRDKQTAGPGPGNFGNPNRKMYPSAAPQISYR